MSDDQAPTPDPRGQRVADLFDRVAQDYDRVAVTWFEPIAEWLVRNLAPQPG